MMWRALRQVTVYQMHRRERRQLPLLDKRDQVSNILLLHGSASDLPILERLNVKAAAVQRCILQIHLTMLTNLSPASIVFL